MSRAEITADDVPDTEYILIYYFNSSDLIKIHELVRYHLVYLKATANRGGGEIIWFTYCQEHRVSVARSFSDDPSSVR